MNTTATPPTANKASVASSSSIASSVSSANSTASATPNNAPKPLGPDSLTWRDFGSYLYHLMLPEAFILQSAHPIIDAAVGKEKKYKLDPWGRAKGSVALLWPVVYSRPDKAIEMGHKLRELHRQIKGTDAQGKAYHALDPEAYSWVHLTGFDSSVRMYEYFGRPLSTADRQRMFEEWKQMGSLLGIHERYIPQTEPEYWQHFNYMIENRLIRGEVVEDLLHKHYFANYPKPAEMKSLPDLAWKMIIGPTGWLLHKISIATLPDSYRRKFNVPFGKGDQMFFKFFAWAVRTFYPLVPQGKRYIPLARRAFADARNHPEAYHIS